VPRPRFSLAPWRWDFATLAGAFVFTACFHVAAAMRSEIDPEAPAWRHLLFVGINLACALGLLVRPLVFIPAFAILTAQQLWSHGAHAWRMHVEQGTVDVPSLAVLAVMPTTLILLILDAWRRRGLTPATASRPVPPGRYDQPRSVPQHTDR
jgi:hypothetical protein